MSTLLTKTCLQSGRIFKSRSHKHKLQINSNKGMFKKILRPKSSFWLMQFSCFCCFWSSPKFVQNRKLCWHHDYVSWSFGCIEMWVKLHFSQRLSPSCHVVSLTEATKKAKIQRNEEVFPKLTFVLLVWPLFYQAHYYAFLSLSLSLSNFLSLCFCFSLSAFLSHSVAQSIFQSLSFSNCLTLFYSLSLCFYLCLSLNVFLSLSLSLTHTLSQIHLPSHALSFSLSFRKAK